MSFDTRERLLVLSEEEDIHSLALLGLARRQGIVVDILDLKDVLRTHTVTADPRHGVFVCGHGRKLTIQHYTGIWWRRPRMPRAPLELRDAPQAVRDFVVRETQAAMNGMFYGYKGNIVNDPLREIAALNKTLQLELAEQCGITIPKTLVTSSPIDATRFIESLHCDAVYKILTNVSFQFVPTRLVSDEVLAHLDRIRLCPVIFQERIKSSAHLRVTVVDGELFVARIVGPEGLLDWRMEMDTQIERDVLSATDAKRLQLFMDRLGLRYGAVDYCLQDDGTAIFLEVNPTGQYLFVELETGQPITEALLRALTRRQPCSNRKA